MKLQRSTISPMFKAFASLDGIKLRPESADKIRYSIARNINALRSCIEDFGKYRADLIDRFSKGKGVIHPQTPEADLFNEEWTKFMDETVEVRLFTLAWPPLDVGPNNIDGSVLAMLDPILLAKPDIGEPDA